MNQPSRPASVAVAIPTWKRAPWLRRLLESLGDLTLPPDEVLVIGRAEDVDARAVAEDDWPWPVRWLEVDRPGHVAPIEVAFREATTDRLAILDDDVEVHPEWLENLVRAFDDPDVACVGGRVLTPGLQARIHPDAGRLRWNGRYVGNVAASLGPRRDVDSVMECNWAWRTDVAKRLTFDPVLDFREAVGYGLDLCLQAKAAGGRVVYDAEAVVYNVEAPRDPGSSIVRDDWVARAHSNGRSYAYIAAKHLPWPRRLAYLAFAFLVGEPKAPGVARAASLARQSGPRQTWRMLAAASVGKLAGTRAAVGGR